MSPKRDKLTKKWGRAMSETGKRIEVGSLNWYYREAEGDRTPVILLHGLVSQGYSWRNVLTDLGESGFRAIAPDWIGCGYSSMPDKREFAYTPDTYLTALEELIAAFGFEKVSIVAQGYLGSMGIQYALRHPEQVERLAIFNCPIFQSAKLPWKLQQMGIPLVGDMMTQDPLLVDRTLEGGGGYRIEDADLDVYRRPWLKTSDVGRALFAIIRNLQLKQVTEEIETGLKSWKNPLLIGWGVKDPWLSIELAKSIGDVVELDEVGHYPQEDWHEKISEILIPFLKQQAV